MEASNFQGATVLEWSRLVGVWGFHGGLEDVPVYRFLDVLRFLLCYRLSLRISVQLRISWGPNQKPESGFAFFFCLSLTSLNPKLLNPRL